RLVLEEETGKLFPASNRARDVRDALFEAARMRGAEFRFGTRATTVAPAGDGRWMVGTDAGDAIEASRVILATGGLSVPNTGSDGGGLRIAAGLGHAVNPTYPALTPLTASLAVHEPLAGISLEAKLTAATARGRFETQG